MPIGYPLTGGGGGGSGPAVTYFAVDSIVPTGITDAFFSPSFNLFMLVPRNGVGFYYAPEFPAPVYQYANSGISSSNGTYVGADVLGRLYRIRLFSTVATAVRSTDDLVNWQTDFGGISINGISYTDSRLFMATNYQAGPPPSVARLFTGGAFTEVYDGIATNAQGACITSTGRLLLGRVDAIRYSDDDGASWANATIALPNTSGTLNYFAVQPDGVIVAGTSNGNLLDSDDDGATWTRPTAPLLDSIGAVNGFAMTADGKAVAIGNSGQVLMRVGPGAWRFLPTCVTISFAGACRIPGQVYSFDTTGRIIGSFV